MSSEATGGYAQNGRVFGIVDLGSVQNGVLLVAHAHVATGEDRNHFDYIDVLQQV